LSFEQGTHGVITVKCTWPYLRVMAHDQRLVVAAATTTKRAASSRLGAAQLHDGCYWDSYCCVRVQSWGKTKEEKIGYILFYKPVLQTVCFLHFYIDFVIDIVKACCILHSYVQSTSTIQFQDTLYGYPAIHGDNSRIRRPKSISHYRTLFADYFVDEGVLSWQLNYIHIFFFTFLLEYSSDGKSHKAGLCLVSKINFSVSKSMITVTDMNDTL
jgi:hypothetical protein